MAEVHGSLLIVKLASTDITAAFHRDDLELTQGERDLLDRTNYGADADRHGVSPIRKGKAMQIGGVFSPELHAFLEPLDGTTGNAFEGFPAGEGSGLPVLGGDVTVTNYIVKSNVYNDATWSATVTPNDGLAWGVDS